MTAAAERNGVGVRRELNGHRIPGDQTQLLRYQLPVRPVCSFPFRITQVLCSWASRRHSGNLSSASRTLLASLSITTMSSTPPMPSTSTPLNPKDLSYPSSSSDPGDDDLPPPIEVFKKIVGGLIISYADGWEWFKRKYGIELDKDHSEDLSIPSELETTIQELGYPAEVEFAPRQVTGESDFVVVTQVAHGLFENFTPQELEVVQDNLKDMLKPGEREEKAREIIFQVYGRRMHGCVPQLITLRL